MLLESLIALALLGTAAIATLSLAVNDQAAVTRALSRSREIQAASAYLDVVALWTRADLNRRLGLRPQGPYALRVLRPTEDVYTLELFDATTMTPLVATAVYRPEVPDAISR